MKSKYLILALLGASALSLSAQIAYQGRLTDDTGAPLSNATRSVTFNLFENSAGGDSAWSEIHQITPVDGRFSVTLGLVDTSINQDIQTHTYLELTVGTDPALSPRQQILASPRSLHALHADTATSATTAGSATTLTGNKWESPGTAQLKVGGAFKVFVGNPAFGDTTMEVKGGHVFVDRNYGFFSSPDGSTAIDAGFDTDQNRNLILYSGGGPRLTMYGDRIFPTVNSTSDSGFQLGQSSHRFYWIWSSVGSIRTSDARLKTNVEDLSYGLDEVMQLRPSSYHWKDNPEGPTSIGLIAQELQEVIPEAVTVGDDKDKMLGVTYTDLIPVLINAVQEQQEQIETLKKQIESLKTAQ